MRGEKKCVFVLCKNVFLCLSVCVVVSCKIDCEVGLRVVCGFKIVCELVCGFACKMLCGFPCEAGFGVLRKRFCQESLFGCDMLDCVVLDCSAPDFSVLDSSA